jgi:hypothetical protein
MRLLAWVSMTFARLLSPALRSGAMIAAGSALIAGPLVLGLSAAAIVAGIAIGALTMALGLAGTAVDGRGTLPLTAHAAYDRIVALVLLIAAILFALADQTAALAIFGGAGLAALLVALTTSYSSASTAT